MISARLRISLLFGRYRVSLAQAADQLPYKMLQGCTASLKGSYRNNLQIHYVYIIE